MNRQEALRVLGLKEGATEAEIKQAYKEMAQILHPDKQGDNEALKARAEEQFKLVNEARDVLLKGKSHSSTRGRSTRGTNTRAAYADDDWEPTQANGPWSAQLEQIAEARAAQVAMMDQLEDRRNIGIILAVLGIAGAFMLKSNVLQAIAVFIGGSGVIDLFYIWNQLGKIKHRLSELDEMKAAIQAKM